MWDYLLFNSEFFSHNNKDNHINSAIFTLLMPIYFSITIRGHPHLVYVISMSLWNTAFWKKGIHSQCFYVIEDILLAYLINVTIIYIWHWSGCRCANIAQYCDLIFNMGMCAHVCLCIRRGCCPWPLISNRIVTLCCKS